MKTRAVFDGHAFLSQGICYRQELCSANGRVACVPAGEFAPKVELDLGTRDAPRACQASVWSFSFRTCGLLVFVRIPSSIQVDLVCQLLESGERVERG